MLIVLRLTTDHYVTLSLCLRPMSDETLVARVLLRNTGCAAKRAPQVSRLTWALAIRRYALHFLARFLW